MTDGPESRTLSPGAVISARHLLASAVQSLLDDPFDGDEAREEWAELATLATDLGLDIAEITLHEGSPFERERLSAIVGVDLPIGERERSDDYLAT